GANADAGIVTALGRDVSVVAVNVDGLARSQDRAGRFHREARDDVLARRYPAEDAAGVVAEKFGFTVAHAHFVCILLARQCGRGKAVADLDAFHRIDAHHRRREIGVELAVERLTESSGHTACHDFDHRAGGRAALAHVIEIAFPGLRGLTVGRPERIVVDRVPVPARAVDLVGPDLDQRAANDNAGAEYLARDGASGDAHRGLARRLAAAAAIIADAVFFPISVVGVTRPELVLDRVVVLAARVLVADQQRDRRAGGLALEHAGQDLDRVAFAALGGEARLTGLAFVEPGLDVGRAQRDQRRRAVDHAADRRPVTFPPGCEAEQVTETVAAQGWFTTTEMSGASTAFMPTT